MYTAVLTFERVPEIPKPTNVDQRFEAFSFNVFFYSYAQHSLTLGLDENL